MPFKSIQQERWGHTAEGMKALGGAAKVAEWDAASRNLQLPKRAKQFKQKLDQAVDNYKNNRR